MNIRKIAQFAIGPIGSAALGFVTLPIITWFYSAEDIGRIAMLQVISSLCILLLSLGLDQAYVREYYEAEQKPALLKATLTPGLLLLTITLGITLLIPGVVSKVLFSIDSSEISWLVGVCLLAGFASRFLSLVLRMQEKGLAFSISQVLPKALFLMVIGSYYLLTLGFDFFHLVIAHTISILAATLVLAWNTRTEWLVMLNQRIDFIQLKKMLRFGMPLIIGGIAYWGLTTMDKLFLRNFSTFEELGIYSVASNFAAAAIIFQSVFSTVWAPTAYKWAAEGIKNEKIDQVTEYVLAVVVFAFAFAGLFSWVVTYLLPEKYDRVQHILVACIAYPLFYTLSETTSIGIGITRKSTYAMLASLTSAFTNLIGNYLLVPIYGAEGAAISTAIAFWIFLVCRTELSCFAWRKFRRLKLYALTLTCLISAIAQTSLHKAHNEFIFIIWITIGLIATLSMKKTLKAAKIKISNHIKKQQIPRPGNQN
ncbi:lipopolysaccharide biosynthesis protein [Pseudomonas sp. AN-1]|uniref:lipopolysaccharide biosynthesis protein n=1 Tax=Pseudomonas sp. AN-1 TaxID=3096605 RepID=UPI002A6B24D2|nr:oligosaccharide flippase family protein [Pseudomonas sp. AN-1]WPP47390.1 oligosaccharide flippase family protein [Pseudomonas sp. AN-1]